MQAKTRIRGPLRARWRPPRAIVTFSGLDGAGKSSQTQRLREALEREGLGAEIEWVPVAINPSIGYVKSVGKRLLGLVTPRPSESRNTPSDPVELDPGKRLVRRSRLVRLTWSSIVTLANVFSHWRSFLRHWGTADVVIFDRYALDTAVRLHTWYGELGNIDFQTWLIQRLSPRPLCSYFLDVPPERALARKVDKWELPTLTRQADLYRRECERFDVRRIDGERSVDALAAEISADVLGRLGREPSRAAQAA